MVAIDTDVLLLAYAFHRDQRQMANTAFFKAIATQDAVVAIYSIMELLGQLSFNLSAERLAQWPSWLQDRYGLTVVYPVTANLTTTAFFQDEFIDRPFLRMQQLRMPYLDGLIVDLIERVNEVEAFVTWNARHYRNKTALSVVTPAEYLEKL
ncbi:MAG: hypothetical protein KDE19_10680 [Caldilineaceae bacterium]|nr:hypothetical protein [Caldilineaceae bacterium]